jgi:hypothetical protein
MLKTKNDTNGLSQQLTRGSSIYQNLSNKFYNRIPKIPSHGQYNITVCSEKKFVWFRVAKVCTRYLFKEFKSNELLLEAEHAQYCRYPIDTLGDFYKFAFVRNPWDRLVSCWRNKVVDSNHFGFDEKSYSRMQEFTTFVEYVEEQKLHLGDPHINLQCNLIDLNAIDYLGRFETFDEDVGYVFDQIKLVQQSKEKVNSGKNNTPFKEYYNAHLVDQVARIYQKDIKIFGYEFE